MKFFFHIAIALICVAPGGLVCADLAPSEIAIIAARGSRGSERLADYYAEQRGIPKENICSIVFPSGETISHKNWKWAVRPEIRKWLDENDPDRNLRCFVTTWDVPLRIDRGEKDDTRLVRYREYLEGERRNRVKTLKDLAAEFELLAPGVGIVDELSGPPTAPAEPASDEDDQQKAAEIEELRTRLEKQLQSAQQRIRKLTNPEDQQAANAQMQRYATAVGGVQVLLESIQRTLEANSESQVALQIEFGRLRGMLVAYTDLLQILERSAPSIERDKTLLDILTRTRGMIASVLWIDKQLQTANKNETQSAFDSELSLIRWPEDDYQLLRWQPNYLRPEYRNSQLRDAFPTMMVARIDAPTLALAKGLIDTAIKVEKNGLEGKVYLDARGIGSLDKTNVAPGSYPDYDRAILVTAKGMSEQTSLEVILDEEPELFQPGDCPDAALYCGWYSLGKYVDAFEWAPGAVAYHLASAEATTLRSEDSQVWCKRMLEEGVCATIGPVYEPYLVAFPRPEQFLSLLIKGNLSLVECYYQSKPFNSWMMTLIGDPLYRPFANRSVLK